GADDQNTELRGLDFGDLCSIPYSATNCLCDLRKSLSRSRPQFSVCKMEIKNFFTVIQAWYFCSICLNKIPRITTPCEQSTPSEFQPIWNTTE
uniref:Uncharacterized protein n=1 Tax=Pelusios castaneus TaxID=367368 RepID=A0A8C8S878_9SAUR